MLSWNNLLDRTKSTQFQISIDFTFGAWQSSSLAYIFYVLNDTKGRCQYVILCLSTCKPKTRKILKECFSVCIHTTYVMTDRLPGWSGLWLLSSFLLQLQVFDDLNIFICAAPKVQNKGIFRVAIFSENSVKIN